MASMKEEQDPLDFAQAHQLMYIACIYNHDIFLGDRFLRKSTNVVRRRGIRFVQAGPDLGFTEEVHERTSFLCELIYSEVQMRILTGETKAFSLDLHKQFAEDLHVRVIY